MIRCLSRTLLVSVLVGCAGSTQEQPTSVVTTTSAIVPQQTAVVVPVRRDTDVFTDDQVLGLVAALNTRGIDLAMSGVEHASDPRIKRLARLLADEHTQARDEEARVSEKLALRAAPTQTMSTLQRDASVEDERLGTLAGPAFDEEWLKDEVKLERDGLALVDLQLVPSAHIPAMQAHLADLREQLDHHLRDLSELERGD